MTAPDAATPITPMGGTGRLRMAVAEGADTLTSLCGAGESENLAALLARREPPVALELEVVADLGRLGQGATDVAVLSLEPFLDLESDAAARSLRSVIEHLRRDVPAHVFAFAGSTALPGDFTANYHGTRPTPAERIARLDLALLQLSRELGVAVIDADRVVASMGTDTNVTGPLQYSEAGAAALRAETERVLEDYGFFERRPVMAQVGAGRGRR